MRQCTDESSLYLERLILRSDFVPLETIQSSIKPWMLFQEVDLNSLCYGVLIGAPKRDHSTFFLRSVIGNRTPVVVSSKPDLSAHRWHVSLHLNVMPYPYMIDQVRTWFYFVSRSRLVHLDYGCELSANPGSGTHEWRCLFQTEYDVETVGHLVPSLATHTCESDLRMLWRVLNISAGMSFCNCDGSGLHLKLENAYERRSGRGGV